MRLGDIRVSEKRPGKIDKYQDYKDMENEINESGAHCHWRSVEVCQKPG